MKRIIYLFAVLSLLVCGALVAQEGTGSGTTSSPTTSCGKVVTGATTETGETSQDGVSDEDQYYETPVYQDTGGSGQTGQGHGQGKSPYDPSKEGSCDPMASGELICYYNGEVLHNCIAQSDGGAECP